MLIKVVGVKRLRKTMLETQEQSFRNNFSNTESRGLTNYHSHIFQCLAFPCSIVLQISRLLLRISNCSFTQNPEAPIEQQQRTTQFIKQRMSSF